MVLYQLLFQLVSLGLSLGFALLGIGQVLLQVPELPLELSGINDNKLVSFVADDAAK